MADSKLSDTEKKLVTMLNGYVSESGKSLQAKIAELDNKLANIRDGIDGKDADEESIIGNVLSQIKLPEIPSIIEDLPKMGEPIRDALELLKEDERLDVSAIKGIKKLIKELTPDGKLGGGTGGLRPSPSGVETPAGTLNGTNKAFTVTFTPQFITLNGQALYSGNGYTLTSASGVLTVTLDAAPASGELLRSHY